MVIKSDDVLIINYVCLNKESTLIYDIVIKLDILTDLKIEHIFRYSIYRSVKMLSVKHVLYTKMFV